MLNLGLLLGIHTLCSNEADSWRKQFASDLRAASSADRKLREEDDDEEIVRGLLHGETQGERPSQHKEVILKHIQKLRTAYDGVVIRRTGNSVDNSGQHIIGLPPFLDTPLLLNLYEWEYQYLDEVAEDLVANSAAATKFAMGRVSPFV